MSRTYGKQLPILSLLHETHLRKAASYPLSLIPYPFLHGIIRDAGHGDYLFGPTIHGVGVEFEEAPLPPGHPFFHGEKAPPPPATNVVIAVGNCDLYTGPWGVRVEDTVVAKPEGPDVLTDFVRQLEA